MCFYKLNETRLFFFLRFQLTREKRLYWVIPICLKKKNKKKNSHTHKNQVAAELSLLPLISLPYLREMNHISCARIVLTYQSTEFCKYWVISAIILVIIVQYKASFFQGFCRICNIDNFAHLYDS